MASTQMHPSHWNNYWRRVAGRFGPHHALEADGLERPLTYDEVLARAEDLAKGMTAVGIGPGVRVLTRLQNDAYAMLVHIALLFRAACELPLPADATDDDLCRLADESDAEWVVTTRAIVKDSGMAQHRHVCHPADLEWAGANDYGNHRDALRIDISALPGRMLPTSGTTGAPRLNLYTHTARWHAHRLQCRLLPHRPAPAEPLLLATPFSHGASLLAMAWWHAGGHVVLYPGVDTRRMLARAAEGRCSIFAPPTVLRKLLDAAPSTALQVRVIFTGTQQLDAATYQRARALFGAVVRVTYGKSECINPICLMQPGQTDAAYAKPVTVGQGCVGRPAPGVEVQIRDDNGHCLPTGQHGHVFLKARHMSAGQWQDGRLMPWPDGWHDASDRGYLDRDGRLWLLGRRGDVVKSGGYLVALEAVDDVLRQLDPERDCAALALPSAYWGAVVVAVVAGSPVHLRERLHAGFSSHPKAMRPRLVISVEALPRNAQGKLMRPRLLDTVLSRYSLTDGPYPRAELRG
ncbi:class I adenylate-forming enzyme family protein [Cupriavidus necator]